MRRVSMLVVATAWLCSTSALAVSTEDFLINDTQDVIDVCTTPQSDPMYASAIAFCHGYLVGAYQYHTALYAKGKPIVCLPDPPPTRAQAIDRFIAWAKAHPEYAKEKGVESLVKFLVETYPCPQSASAAKSAK